MFVPGPAADRPQRSPGRLWFTRGSATAVRLRPLVQRRLEKAGAEPALDGMDRAGAEPGLDGMD